VPDENTPLSEREMEILQLVATGATNQQVAQKLVISVNTVKVHLRNIYSKLEVGSRTEATMVAVREGWVDVPGLEDHAGEGEGGTAPAEQLPLSPALPQLERWPRVGRLQRAGLVAATLLAAVFLFVPMAIESHANGQNADPIRGVFPTAPSTSSTNRWRTRAQMPTPRTGLAAVADQNLIYAIAGISNEGATGKVEVYDPQADAWTLRKPKPTPVGFVSAALIDGKIYVPGGVGADGEPTAILEVYDPALDRWENRAPMPEPLEAYALAVLDDQIYLFGGRDGTGYVASVSRYDPATDRWVALRPMAAARGFLGAAALDGRIYVIGGYDGVSEYKSCDVYDPATDAWMPCAPMALHRGGLVVVPVREQLYAIGGGMDGYLAFNERYDPRTNTWTRIESPVTEQWRGLGAAFVSPYVYTIGGWNERNLSVNEAFLALYVTVIP
jgi:DNA-binding CsgD family transcriptional regulator/N-acetylneuraminic acid mutarotase